MNDQDSSVRISQGYDVLLPRGGKAYSIPCSEWAFIKSQIGKVTDHPWILQNLGSVLLGAAVAAFFAIMSGAIPEAAGPKTYVAAWCFALASLLGGFLCYWCAQREGSLRRSHAADIVAHMDQIETRYSEIADSNETAITEAKSVQETPPPSPKPTQAKDRQSKHIARTLGDLVTPKQLGQIRALAYEAGAEAPMLCEALFGCRLSELSKTSADTFIKFLEEFR